MRYNAACALLRKLGEPEEALDTLEGFFKAVTSNTWIWHAEADPDFKTIRDDPRFKEMLASAKQRLGMTEPAAPPPEQLETLRNPAV
jgi:hypothetical protein